MKSYCFHRDKLEEKVPDRCLTCCSKVCADRSNTLDRRQRCRACWSSRCENGDGDRSEDVEQGCILSRCSRCERWSESCQELGERCDDCYQSTRSTCSQWYARICRRGEAQEETAEEAVDLRVEEFR